MGKAACVLYRKEEEECVPPFSFLTYSTCWPCFIFLMFISYTILRVRLALFFYLERENLLFVSKKEEEKSNEIRSTSLPFSLFFKLPNSINQSINCGQVWATSRALEGVKIMCNTLIN